MKVTIENYTECCLRTWGGENQKERAELGIIGELGEVAEVLKKFLRGDFDEVERDKRLLKELGDVWYYIAVDIYLHEQSFLDNTKGLEYIVGKVEPTINTIVWGYNTMMDSGEYNVFIDSVFNFTCHCGFTLEQVMQANIDKLSDRAKRDKIQGDGDFR